MPISDDLRKLFFENLSISYAAGYMLNLLVLLLLVDFFHFPHQIVQAGMIIFLAFFLFALQKFWMFGTIE